MRTACAYKLRNKMSLNRKVGCKTLTSGSIFLHFMAWVYIMASYLLWSCSWSMISQKISSFPPYILTFKMNAWFFIQIMLKRLFWLNFLWCLIYFFLKCIFKWLLAYLRCISSESKSKIVFFFCSFTFFLFTLGTHNS